MILCVCSAAHLVLRAAGAILWHLERADRGMHQPLHRLHLPGAGVHLVLPQTREAEERKPQTARVSPAPALPCSALPCPTLPLPDLV